MTRSGGGRSAIATTSCARETSGIARTTGSTIEPASNTITVSGVGVGNAGVGGTTGFSHPQDEHGLSAGSGVLFECVVWQHEGFVDVCEQQFFLLEPVLQHDRGESADFVVRPAEPGVEQAHAHAVIGVVPMAVKTASSQHRIVRVIRMGPSYAESGGEVNMHPHVSTHSLGIFRFALGRIQCPNRCPASNLVPCDRIRRPNAAECTATPERSRRPRLHGLDRHQHARCARSSARSAATRRPGGPFPLGTTGGTVPKVPAAMCRDHGCDCVRGSGS